MTWRGWLRSTSTVVPLLLAMGSCGGSDDSEPTSVEFPVSIDVGGRDLSINCVGTAGPTVVMVPGLGTAGDTFDPVAAGLSDTTRVCTYDRAGLGDSGPLASSDPDPSGASAAADLDALLTGARVAAPYVLVGWSYGGIVARLFAADHPNEVSGLLLKDSAVPEMFTGAFFADLDWTEGGRPIDTSSTAAAVEESGDLGDLPLVVLTQDAHPGAFERIWSKYQADLATLSTNSVHVVAVDAGHEIHATDAEVMQAAILDLVKATRSESPLLPCDARYTDAGGRCE